MNVSLNGRLNEKGGIGWYCSALVILSVLRRIFICILFMICRFYTALETHVGIRIVQTLAINLLTSTDPS